MSSSESERECLITGFKSGDGNRFDHNDCKVANGDQLHSQFQTNFIHSFEKILTKENILREVYSYARGKRDNSRSTDLFLEAFSRIYKCKLILIDSEEDIDDLVIGEENMEKVIGCTNEKTTLIFKVIVKNISVWNKRKQQMIIAESRNVGMRNCQQKI